MHWLQSCDVQLFRFVNQTLSNQVFDVVMPLVSGNALTMALLYPLVAIVAVWWMFKAGPRGVLFLLMLAGIVALGDGFICKTIKDVVARERPFLALADVHCLVGRGGSGSMPSTHAANWFAATMVAMLYYRRSLWFMLPVALLVSFSRVYNGVHYPSDVLVGAILGAGYAAAAVCLLNSLWRVAGQKWFPIWWQAMPSLIMPPARAGIEEHEEAFSDVAPPSVKGQSGAHFRPLHATLDEHWLRLGYIWMALLLVARWAYIASGTIELAEDEAYQWLWSKHLALSYFSKPPLIAYTQFLGTSLWGDNAFGVRFFSPLIATCLGLVTLRFFAREVNARAGFCLLLILTATPLLSVGSMLMTVDPLSVLFWTLAMFSGWRAAQEKGTTRDWLWVGLWMGLGFLGKYTELLQILCWAVFFVLWRPARKHLRRPGPYLALLVNAICALPVLIWNWQHNWITVAHVATNAGAGQPWRPRTLDFLASEAALLNPVFFGAALWAAIALWRRNRNNPRLVYFFSMGAPLFLCYFLWSFRSRLLPNWIAPSVLPLFCMMVIYWDTRLRLGVWQVRSWLGAGLVLGGVLVLVGHNTDIWRRTWAARTKVADWLPNGQTLLGGVLAKPYLPVNLDPLHRVREWANTAHVVDQFRQQLMLEQRPVFIITDHYGMAGQISFSLPEARTNVLQRPLVYCRSSPVPENQFYFWPGYENRKGENAIYVIELDRRNPIPYPVLPQLANEFDSVTSIGVTNVLYHGLYVLRPLQIFACRGLK